MISLPQQILRRAALKIQRPDYRKIITLRFAITYKCNSKCWACNIWKKSGNSSNEEAEELTLNQIKQVFLNSRYLSGLKTINLDGGETTQRDDFVYICGFFITTYPQAQINITTNALDAQSTIMKLKDINSEYRPRDFNIYTSLDGINETHDKMRGIVGAYDKTIQFINELRDQVSSFGIGVTFTITPINYKELFAVYKLAKDLDVDFIPVFAQNSKVYYDNEDKQFNWNEAELKEIGDMLDRIRFSGGGSRRLVPRIFREIDGAEAYYLANMLKSARQYQRIIPCYSGTHSLFMDPYGNIFPCIMLSEVIGNVKECSFDEIWTSDRAQQVRKLINEAYCTCWTPCETFPSLSRSFKVVLYNIRSNIFPCCDRLFKSN